RHDREGGRRAEGKRRLARVRVRGARRAVGPGDRAARSGADRPGDHHDHDPADHGSGEVLQEDQAALGGAAAGTGDSEYSRGDIGLFIVRIGTDSGLSTEHCTRRECMDATLQAEKRDGRGKNEARRLRASGRIPAVVYGAEKGKAVEIAVDPKILMRILHSESGVNTLIGLKVDGGDTRVMVKEYQIDPIDHKLLHADFYQVAMDKTITVTVPIVLKGEAKGVKQQGGIVDFVNREIHIEVLHDA